MNIAFSINAFWGSHNKTFQNFKIIINVFFAINTFLFSIISRTVMTVFFNCILKLGQWMRFRNFANDQPPPLWLFRFPSIARTDWTSHSIRGELLSLAVDCGISRLRHPVAGVLSLSSVPDFPHFPCVPFHGLSHQRFSLTARVGVCALERYWICVTAKTRSHFRFEISSQLHVDLRARIYVLTT